MHCTASSHYACYLTWMLQEMLSLTFKKTIGCYRFEWCFCLSEALMTRLNRSEDLLSHKKTATEVAVFIYLEIMLLVGYPQRASLG